MATTEKTPAGIKYCRSCYKHLAGFVGVQVTEALVRHGYLIQNEADYSVTEDGWVWFKKLGIVSEDFKGKYRPLTKQCLDFSERRPHLAGLLGQAMLQRMLELHWLERIPGGRSIKLTDRGKKALQTQLDITYSSL